MQPDTALAERIAEGHGAEQALAVFSDLLSALEQEQLKRADALAEDGKLTPELAFPLLMQVCGFRRITNRLNQKVTRGANAAAARNEAERADLAPAKE